MKEFSFKINGTEYKTSVKEIEGGITEVTVNGKTYQVEMEQKKAPVVAPKPAPAAAPKAEAPKAVPVAKPAASAGGKKVTSPLPGSVIKVLVSEGQAVKKGDALLTLESMKMENTIAAEWDGTVKQILVTAGQNVMQEDVLLVME